MKLILASASPRRRDLLCEAGIEIRVVPAHIDEQALPRELPAEHVRRLAGAKADHVAAQMPDCLVLGADTVVAHQNRIFGKPDSLDDAKTMLNTLSGSAHEVLTGVCLRRLNPECLQCWVCRTKVCFRELTPNVIDRYCSLVNPLDKAGAYAIQEHGEMLISSIDGLMSNVIGLPVEEVLERLKKIPHCPTA